MGGPKPPARRRRTPGAGGAGANAAPARFYYKGSRLKQLRAFCMIVKLGTLSRAAEALFLSQPSVSLQLRALERELGTPLIERRRRRVAPTREGQALYELALPLVEGLDSLGEWRLLLLPDHPTYLRTRTHTADPVPYLLATSARSGPGGRYSEAAVNRDSPVAGHTLMSRLVAPALH